MWFKTLLDFLPLHLRRRKLRNLLIGTPPTGRKLPSLMPFLLLKALNGLFNGSGRMLSLIGSHTIRVLGNGLHQV
jgi:hypothetical protein